MDFLDPAKQARHRIILWVGYVLISVAIVIGALILLYQAYGFGIGKNGTVIQNGLVFFSSQPNPAKIYLNGKLNPAQTNARLSLSAGIYHTKLTRAGYQPWQRTIEVEGGDVQHFDYPFFVPQKLTSKKIQSYNPAPGLATQSLDRRWLLVEKPGSVSDFTVYDLKNQAKAPIDISLPANVMSKAAGSQSLQLEEWASDNKHVVLQHDYDGKIEFVLIDRTDPSKSENLNDALSVNPTKLTLINKKYDQYYLFNAPSAVLQKATLAAPAPVTVLEHTLAYQSYSDDTFLYATDAAAPAGKVAVRLKIGDQTYPVRTFPAGTNYLVDLTKYSGTLYLAVGATSQDKVYIYKDPVGQLRALPKQAIVPSQVLHVPAPNYVSFSNNAQFIMAEDNNQFGVYDIENEKGYNYTLPQTVQPPMLHAGWMDGNRMMYVSQGQALIFDYDGTNVQPLVAASADYLPAFSPDFKFLYTFAPAAAPPGQMNFNQTSMLAPADQ